MANTFHLPPGNFHELRPGLPAIHGNARLRGVAPASPVPPPPAAQEEPDSASGAGNQAGPRKLVRPKLPEGKLRDRAFGSRGESPILTHQAAMMTAYEDHAATNAEAFYFQKQVQTQMLMVFVLEDGEQVEGYIEWYDRDAIKVRNGRRTLIYKSAIKYLYKAGDLQAPLNGFKNAR